jgi:hypothetical protein
VRRSGKNKKKLECRKRIKTYFDRKEGNAQGLTYHQKRSTSSKKGAMRKKEEDKKAKKHTYE